MRDEVSVGARLPATVSSAASKIAGNTFILAAARLMISKHAFALKKNRCGIGPVSKINNSPHALASLGESEMLSIENPPSDPCPWPGNHTCTRPFSAVVKSRKGII